MPTSDRDRPSRRGQLASIAAELFAQKGFHNVSVNDIAAAAGVSGPSIYRHFKSKQAILAHLVCEGLDETAEIVERRLADSAAPGVPSDRPLKAVYGELAAYLVKRPEFGVLWRREGRYLSAEERVGVADALARGMAPLVRELGRSRPGLNEQDAELLSWAALSVFGSISEHRLRLPQAALERLLTAIALDVLDAELPGASSSGGSTTRTPVVEPPVFDTRRKQLLAVAARLFRERGYHAVSIEDIGAAAGIAGPSIYSHVGGKMELLQAAADRIGERLEEAVELVRTADLPARAALDFSVGCYVDIVLGHRDLVAAYFREGHNLPDRDRVDARRWQRTYTEFWADLVTAAAPEQSPKETRIRVHAAFAVVNDLAQTGRFAARPHVPEELRTLMLTVLAPARPAAHTSVRRSAMEYTEIAYEVNEHIATVILNRPDTRNAYTARMADEAASALRAANADDEVRVVVLTGAGNDFCVGADLSSGSLDTGGTDDTAPASAWTEPATRVARELFRSDKPVIAAVRGAAVGVGSTMILPADFRIAADDSRFGFVFSRRGIYPEGGSSWFLPRLVGMGRASDWMISGRLIGADEALAAGLVTAVHKPANVLDKAYELARELIATTAPVSTAVIRQTLYRMSALDSPEPAFALDSRLIASIPQNPDAIEGVTSFLERRPPAFTGRAGKDQPDFLPWRTSIRTDSPEEDR